MLRCPEGAFLKIPTLGAAARPSCAGKNPSAAGFPAFTCSCLVLQVLGTRMQNFPGDRVLPPPSPCTPHAPPQPYLPLPAPSSSPPAPLRSPCHHPGTLWPHTRWPSCPSWPHRRPHRQHGVRQRCHAGAWPSACPRRLARSHRPAREPCSAAVTAPSAGSARSSSAWCGCWVGMENDPRGCPGWARRGRASRSPPLGTHHSLVWSRGKPGVAPAWQEPVGSVHP